MSLCLPRFVIRAGSSAGSRTCREWFPERRWLSCWPAAVTPLKRFGGRFLATTARDNDGTPADAGGAFDMNRKSDVQYVSELKELFTTPRAAIALSSRLQPASSVGNWLGNLR